MHDLTWEVQPLHDFRIFDKALEEKIPNGKEFLSVTPGISPAWTLAEKDDQRRVTTSASAIKNGSDYLVIGRPIRDAKDPVSAAVRTTEEIE
ncbi:MAG: orotidine 5'-phosphate decarboxylase / HUMPS family protein [Thermodesulfobacteriota bacterium]